jgi:hypothetical protein
MLGGMRRASIIGEQKMRARLHRCYEKCVE